MSGGGRSPASRSRGPPASSSGSSRSGAGSPGSARRRRYEYFARALAHARRRDRAPSPSSSSTTASRSAALAGRVESRRLETALGYKVVYAPRVRLLHVVDGGLVAADRRRARRPARRRSGASSRGGERRRGRLPAAAARLRPLRAPSTTLGGPLERQPLIAPWTRRRLVLPATLRGVRRLAELEHALADPPRRQAARRPRSATGSRSRSSASHPGSTGSSATPTGSPRSTYQRALGAGFADTPEQRALAAVGLEHGWMRGYLLYLDAEPIAYWLCSIYGGTILIRTAGFDNAYAEHRVGIYLLMRVDRGRLRRSRAPRARLRARRRRLQAAVQQRELAGARTSSSSRRRFRGRRINATRTAILGAAFASPAACSTRPSLTDRVRTRWRSRLRRG